MNINKLIFEFLKDNKKYLLAYIIFMISYPISAVFLPKYYGQIVEDLKEGKNPKFQVTVILLLLTNVMYLILDNVDMVFIPKLQAYIRINIVKVILENYKDKFQEQELGTLISKIVKLPIVIRDLVWQVRNHIVPIILILLMVIVRFTIIDKRLGAITIAGIITGFSVLAPKWKACLDISSDMDNEADVIHEDISELFDNLLDIYASNTSKRELENLEKRQEEVIDRYKSTFECTNNLRGWLNVISIVTFLSVIIYAYHLYKRKELDLGDMMNVAITGMFIINKIGSFSGEIPDMVFNLGIYTRTQAFLQKLDISDGGREQFQIPRGGIQFNDVGIKYGDKQILKQFNLNISPGESVAIIGKIGCGKSSLAKALMKLIVYEGVIRIDGKDIEELDPSTVRSQILFVRQNPLPFNRTLYENIVYGNEKVSKEDVNALFGKYNLHSFFDRSLDERVGKKGDKLSGGQKMVMFLLRIMLQNNKKIVILDEPTSSLDNVTAMKIMDMIKDVTKNQTTIIITHDSRLHDIVDRVVKIT